MIGEVKDKDVLLVDDMIDTAGTIVHAANFIKEKGAKSVRVAATHGVFSGEALKIINESAIEEMIITDTIKPREEVLANKKISIVYSRAASCRSNQTHPDRRIHQQALIFRSFDIMWDIYDLDILSIRYLEIKICNFKKLTFII